MPHIDINFPSIYDRALGAGGGPATTENIQHLPSQTLAAASQSATSFAQEAGDGDGQNSRGMTRTILEWAFAVVALVLVATLSVWKYHRLKRNRARARALAVPSASAPPSHYTGHYVHALSVHFSRAPNASTAPPDTADSLDPEAPSAPPRSRRAARGPDIDVGGRRGAEGIGAGEEGDEDLPAYEPKGGPPKYVEWGIGVGGEGDAVEMRDVGSRRMDEEGRWGQQLPPPFDDMGESPRASTSTNGDFAEEGAGNGAEGRDSGPRAEPRGDHHELARRRERGGEGIVEERDITDADANASAATQMQTQLHSRSSTPASPNELQTNTNTQNQFQSTDIRIPGS